MGRKPSNVVNAEINRLRRYIENPENTGKSDQDAITELGIRQTTFYRYKQKIREQDKQAWLEMAKESLEERSGKIMKAIDFSLKINKEIANNSADDRAKIAATQEIIQANVWAMQLLERGPNIMKKIEGKIITIEPETQKALEPVR